MKGSKSYGRFICGSLAVSFAVSPFLSLTVLADNISSANFDLRRQVVKLTGIMGISSFRGQITRGDFAKMLVRRPATGKIFLLPACRYMRMCRQTIQTRSISVWQLLRAG